MIVPDRPTYLTSPFPVDSARLLGPLARGHRLLGDLRDRRPPEEAEAVHGASRGKEGQRKNSRVLRRLINIRLIKELLIGGDFPSNVVVAAFSSRLLTLRIYFFVLKARLPDLNLSFSRGKSREGHKISSSAHFLLGYTLGILGLFSTYTCICCLFPPFL